MASLAQQQDDARVKTANASGVTPDAGANAESVGVPWTGEEGASRPVRADRDGVVRKHVNTIALMPTDRRIGLLTRKLFNVMLRLAQQQGDTET